MKVVVSDTSSISNLIVIGRLTLLQKVYSHILIPPAVWHEIIALEKQGINLTEFRNSSWIEMIPINHEDLVLMHPYKLDAGEKEAIALAKLIQADLLIIDEKRGRDVAKELGIKTIGLLGAIINAKVLDETISVMEILDELVIKAGFWISADLYQEVLRLSEEL